MGTCCLRGSWAQLCDDLEEWGGGCGLGGELPEGGDTCVHTADSSHRAAESNTPWENDYIPINKMRDKEENSPSVSRPTV